MLQAILGIFPYAPASFLLLDPHLPEWLPEMSVDHLRIGNSYVSLRFSRRSDGVTDFEVLDMKGSLNVVRCSNPWQYISAWVENTDEFIFSLRSENSSKLFGLRASGQFG
jgi:hypothetical protein